MGNSMSLQGQPAAAAEADALHGPARLSLALKHAAAAHAAAEASPFSGTTSSTSSSTPSPTTQKDPAAQQAHSDQGHAHPTSLSSSSSSSSRNSSSISLSSRGFTNDDTMPWRGSLHGSHGSLPDLADARNEGHAYACDDTIVDIPDQDRCLQCNLVLPAVATAGNSSSSSAGMRLVASRSMRAGQLLLHPKSGAAVADQVVWALPQQQLLNALQPSSRCSNDAAAAAAPAMQLVSPAFVLPCPAVGSGSRSVGRLGLATQHVQVTWCLVLHPTPPAADSPQGVPACPATNTHSTLSSSSSSWQLSLRANWSAATLPDASAVTQQQQQQQMAAPEGPSFNAAAQQQQQLGGSSSSSGASTAVAAMHGWQLQCGGRVELLGPACSSGAAAGAAAAGAAGMATAGVGSSTGGSDFHVLLQHSNQEAVLPFSFVQNALESSSSSSSSTPSITSKTSSTGRITHQTADQTSSSSSGEVESYQLEQADDSSSSDSSRACDKFSKPAAGSSAEECNYSQSDGKVLQVLLSFKQLQLVCPASEPSGGGNNTVNHSDIMQVEQQPAGSGNRRQLDGQLNSSSSSNTSSQLNSSPDPNPSNPATTTARNACTSSGSRSGTAINNPGSSALTDSLQQLSLSSPPNSTAAAAAAAGPAAALPAALPAAAAPPVVERRLEAVLLSTAPRLLVVDDFFDAGLCEGLMNLANDKLVRSRVASGSETPSRTSWSHFFVKDAAKHALVAAAEGQIEALFGCPALRGPHKPLEKIEAIQVIKYHKGEFYHEHYDNRADSPLTRAATIIVYLADTDAGGATSFPRAVLAGQASGSYAAAPAGSAAFLPGLGEGAGFGVQGGAGREGSGFGDGWRLPPKVSVGARGVGIKVHPVRGRAVVFWSKRPDGSEDPNSIHAADTVQRGEKWIATRWMRDAQQ